MAVQWSGYDNAGNNGMRIGLDESHGSVGHTTTSVTFTFDAWTGNLYPYSDNGQTIVWSGNISGTDTYNNTQGSGSTTKRATRSYTFTYPSNSYGSSPGNVSVTVRVGYSYNGSHPQITRTVAIPARPIAVPNVPGTVRSSRVSDTQISVAITAGGIGPARPVSSTTIQRHQWNGNTGWSAWTTVATLPGAPTSWTDTGTQANQLYSYQVRYNNAAGSSGWSVGNTSSTTPSAPVNVSASLSGTSITVKWGNVVNYYPYDSHFVERSTNGGAWTQVAADLSWAATSWIDTAPGGGSNQYRVRSRSGDGGAGNPALFGPYGTSNVVSTIVPPLAPTLLVPNGFAEDAHRPISLTWQHNPGGDNAPQTAYQIRYSSNSGSTWTTIGPVTSATSQHVLPADTLANGTSYLWQVATKGTHANYGPWSASATLPVSSTPVVTLTSPPATVTAIPVLVSWLWSQDEGQAQTTWQAELGDGATTLQVASGTTETEWQPTVPLTDGATYQVRVRARATSGLWSDWQTTTFTVDLLPPADVTVAASLDEGTGWMVLELHADDPVPGVSAPVDHVDVQRRIDGGEWVTLHTDIQVAEADATVLDTTPSLLATMEYRLVVTSVSPSTAITDPVAAITEGVKSTPWGFLSWGPGFTRIVRAAGNPSLSDKPERARASQRAMGRAYPILLVGDQLTRVRSVNLLAVWGAAVPAGRDASTDHEWIAASLEAELVCWRDWRGVRIFGRLDGMQVNPQPRDQSAEISFAVEQTDYREGVA